jgi:acetyltransferase-like isoleucine patch superfamily enzyme
MLPKNLLWILTTRIGSWRMRRGGHRVGPGTRLLGLPLVHGPGCVTLGTKVTLTSDPRGTALGTRGRVILNAMHKDAQIIIGDHTGMSGGVICAAGLVEIGRRCLLGADVMIFDTDFHPLEPDGRRFVRPDWPAFHRPTIIEDDVFIGTRSIVAKGIRIGRGSVIGAGSVVSTDIPAGVIAAGVPAKVIRAIRSADITP